MVNIELYINGALIDVGRDFNIRLNRQLIKPAELNTKDAKYSYSISLPPTPVNNKAFGFANVEEIKGKFNLIYKAQLVINSIQIFVGNFRLSEISKKGFKGNLYVPVSKSIKDIFGNFNLNEMPEYRIPFSNFASSVTSMNIKALAAPQIAIFPYVLYGLLPKMPSDKNAVSYSDRNLWDTSVNMSMQSVPPSINPLLMIKHLFKSQGYEITGTAFNDSRLTQIYQSYHNPTDYVQPWNYGHHAKMGIKGEWSSTINKRNGLTQYEKGVFQSYQLGQGVYGVNLLDAMNSKIEVTNNPGGNVINRNVKDNRGDDWAQTQMHIPATGFYKIIFSAQVNVYDNKNWRKKDPATGIQHISGIGGSKRNSLSWRAYEVKLLRDKKSGDFGVSNVRIDGLFYKPNQPQDSDFSAYPKYFPQVPNSGQLNFIDQAQNKKHVLGFTFGAYEGARKLLPASEGSAPTSWHNPRDVNYSLCQMTAAKPGLSWDFAEDEPNKIAVQSPGYWKYGVLGKFDAGDNPDIDYSEGIRVKGKVLNANGNPYEPDTNSLYTRFDGYSLNEITGFQSLKEGWTTSDFIEVRNYKDLKFSAEVPSDPEVAVLVFYDKDKMPIGTGIKAKEASYNNLPIEYPKETVYIRLSAKEGTLIISGEDTTVDNVILYRFPLKEGAKYSISGGFDYAYIHNNGDVFPVQVIPFKEGSVEFDTLYYTKDPKLTLYLKKNTLDVDGTLSIRKEGGENSDEAVGWEITDKYAINLKNAPSNFVARTSDWSGEGQISAVVWLEAGELLTVAASCLEGRYQQGNNHVDRGWTNHEISFNIDVEPFRIDEEWLKVDYQGHGTAAMNWEDPVNFDVDSINLVGFLPSDIKVNDYIDNFVKAFNLKLTQVDSNTFSLDIKQAKKATSSVSINLDNIASVKDRVNTPIGLPSSYKIGFTIDKDEEGYYITGDDGGGIYNTGSIENTIIEQKNNFSYCWYKDIIKVEPEGNITIPIPVISKHEVWTGDYPYGKDSQKSYTNLALRFWYLNGFLEGSYFFNKLPIVFARVSNDMPEGKNILNYKNLPNTLLNNYFNIIGIGSESHYTEVEAYLTPVMFERLNGSYSIQFNGDQYYVAEVEGYDPTNKNKAKIKLIRKK